MAIQGKYWCFTYNNPEFEEISLFGNELQSKGATYVFYALEQGDSGTPHYQGYVEFDKLKRLSQLKKIDNNVHWERRKGTQTQAIAYCKKDEGKPGWAFCEYGHLTETHQGARNDLSFGIELLNNGGLRRVATEAPELYVRNHRGLSALSLMLKPPKPVPTVVLAFGPPGVGKSRRFYEVAPESSRWTNPIDTTGLWFDTYVNDKWACIEDFGGKRSHYTLANLLRLLDRYDVVVPIKGGHVWWVPEYIYITTNYHPRDWYDWSERAQQWRALVRRFDFVQWWKSDPSEPVELDPEHPDWEHFWDGSNLAQLALDKQSGLLISKCPPEYYNF